MKRTVAILAGTLALAVGAYVCTSLSAQTGAAPSGAAPTAARPAAAPQTRIALVNIRFVIKHYEKYKAFMEEMKKQDQLYVDQIKGKQTQRDNLAKQLQTAVDGPAKEKIEGDIRNLQREIEDVTNKARKDVSKRGNDEMIKVYKEIRDAAARHALSNNFDLVLHFEGATDKDEVDNPALIMRNMNAGGAVPLYWNSGLDISSHVLQALNHAFRSAGGTPAAAPAGGAAPAGNGAKKPG